jgi:hypothetical protein
VFAFSLGLRAMDLVYKGFLRKQGRLEGFALFSTWAVVPGTAKIASACVGHCLCCENGAEFKGWSAILLGLAGYLPR